MPDEERDDNSPGSGDDWSSLGVDPERAEQWRRRGFDAFEAAMAQGDGFTPSFAAHYQHHLRTVAGSWRDVRLDTAEGLRWHRRGFGAREAARWRARGVEVEDAAAMRAGYDVAGAGS